MKRRDFLKKSTVVAGLASSPGLIVPLVAEQARTQRASKARRQTGEAQEIRSPEYLQNALADEYSPKPPVLKSSCFSAGAKIAPMPLAERLRRNIVPRRGFCSIAPGSDALLISGNGSMSIDASCDRHSEQIVFRHES